MRVWRRVAPLICTVLAVVLGGVAWIALTRWVGPLDGTSAHLDLQFKGRADFAEVNNLERLRILLLVDAGVTVALAVAYRGFIGMTRKRTSTHRHLDPRLVKLGERAVYLAYGAAAAALIQNGIVAIWIERKGTEFVLPAGWVPDAVTGVAAAKWLLALGAASQLLWHVGSLSVRRPDPEVRPAPPAEFDKRPVGVCLSGGGIRSAAFSLGAMREFEATGFLDQVDALSAVSGGNYTATGWMVGRASDRNGDDLVTDRLIDHLLRGASNNPFRSGISGSTAAVVPDLRAMQVSLDDGGDTEAGTSSAQSTDQRQRSIRGRHRFLFNGPGGLPRAILQVVVAISCNIVQIGAVVVALGWPLGRFLGEDVYPNVGDVLSDRDQRAPDFRWLPGLYVMMAGCAGLVLAVAVPALFRDGYGHSRLARLTYKARRYFQQAGAGVLGVGALVFVVIAAGPWLLVAVYSIGGGPSVLPVGIATIGAIAGIIWRVIGNPARQRAPRLGGVLLALALVILLGKVVHDSASASGMFSDSSWWFGAMMIVATTALLFDTQAVSIRELYRARLTNSFVFDQQLRPIRFRDRSQKRRKRVVERFTDGVPWTHLPERPELIVCCAASRVGLAPNGMPAESFTISQHFVHHHRAAGIAKVATDDYLLSLSSLGLSRFRSPAGWMATSGAAFASAMGRSSLGTTNALLAAANVDLGVWLPSPRQVQHRVDVSVKDDADLYFPPVRLGHLVNEVFGFYGPYDDHVFVSDGGHVENLGLVELLRRGARLIVCLDASRDEPGSFATLRAALELADTELSYFERVGDATVRRERRLAFDLRELDASRPVAESVVYRIPFCPRGETCTAPDGQHTGTTDHGWIYYIKLQRSLDQPLNLRLFSRTDPGFPNYSTANQFLDDQEFMALLYAGRHGAQVALERMRADGLFSAREDASTPAATPPTG